jgi:hypothetical protein
MIIHERKNEDENMKLYVRILLLCCLMLMVPVVPVSAQSCENFAGFYNYNAWLNPNSHSLAPGDDVSFSLAMQSSQSPGWSFDHANYFIWLDPHIQVTDLDYRCVPFGDNEFYCDSLGYPPYVNGIIKPDTLIGTTLTSSFTVGEYYEKGACYDVLSQGASTDILVVAKTLPTPVPEFPTPVLPLLSVIGFVSAVILIKKIK